MKRQKITMAALLAMILMVLCVGPALAAGEEAGGDQPAPHICHPREVTVQPTCEKDGSITVYYCSDPNCPLKLYNVMQSQTPVAKLGHDFSKEGKITKEPTCTETGTKVFTCSRCPVQKTETIPATGHKMSEKIEVLEESTCEKAGRGLRRCQNPGCKHTEEVILPLKDHSWKTVPAVAPTCEKDGNPAYRVCSVCGKIDTKDGKAPVTKALGHDLGDVEVIKPATCTEKGEGIRRCRRDGCDFSTKVEIPAAGHKAKWETVEKATPEKDGLSVKKCTVCGEILERKILPYKVMMYNNTITSLGPCTRDLIGGTDWYRVTPIDLTKEGTFTYPMIASNRYAVGMAAVTVENGILTVTYQLDSRQIDVRSQTLMIYPNVDSLRTGEGVQTFSFGQPINILEAFGEDQKVILSLFLKADYNSVAHGVTWFREDLAQINLMSQLLD